MATPAAAPAEPPARAAPAGSASAKEPNNAFIADLLVSCPDQKGVVAALAQLLFGYGCNIICSDQFSDLAEQHYFQRLQVDFSELIVGPENVNGASRRLAARSESTSARRRKRARCERAHKVARRGDAAP